MWLLIVMKTHYLLSKVQYQLSPKKQLATRTCRIDKKTEENMVYSLLWQAQNTFSHHNPIYETITRHIS